MPDINPGLPIIGQPDSTEEPKVVTALSQLIAAVNNVDSAQLADLSIVAADIADATIVTAKMADDSITAPKMAPGAGTRLLGFLNSDAPKTFGLGVANFLNAGTGLAITHTHPTAVAVVMWGFYNPGPATTTAQVEVLLGGVSQGVLDFIPTLAQGESCILAAAQQITVTPGAQSWNARATQGTNAVTMKSQGPALLLVCEQS